MALKVTPVLGVVKVLSGGLLADNFRAANNNTRWMFDVEGVPEGEGDLSIQLIELRGRDFSPDLAACFFAAQSEGFYQAKPFELERVGGVITIRQNREVLCKYRVMVDTMHTATR